MSVTLILNWGLSVNTVYNISITKNVFLDLLLTTQKVLKITINKI